MTDQNLKNTAPEQFNFTPQEKTKSPLERDETKLHETKISVGLEAEEILEGEEMTSGEISEKNRAQKDNYGNGSKNGQKVVQSNYELNLPRIKNMKKEVRKELEKEIDFLKKKIDFVMKKNGTIDAHNLNNLMRRLRQLREILSSLAHGAADMVKDLWIKYVRERRQKRKL
ncbi:hypothetical protein KKD70_01545 [Patescibacteria group bacterium]|nr:hypothetical protein [Patescibacteria group bacterium]